MSYCKNCGIAEDTGDGMLFCHKYKTAVNFKISSRQECIYYTTKIDEDGEILSPQEHLYLKEAELAVTPRKKTISLPNRRRFIAKNFATYPGNRMQKGLL
ncbi:hypothetical protein [Desulfolucanica intricata]|uniref:hypothetical protein n=1 Tax=Desulfolucanica intricata TaxID=1285191 RepID=UPI00083007E9|nr:hypothetical protein [Desulfolucanica intricata]